MTFVFLASCGKRNNNDDLKVTNLDSVATKIDRTLILRDRTEKFLWREEKYDEELKDTFNTIIINEKLCKTLTEPETAALGYVATYIGSECQWDGECNDNRSNLKCKILTALNLGYQCSERHLGFLRKWFMNDTKVLEEFNTNCPTVPYTASSQNTFDEITLKVKGNNISVWYSASGINMPMGESWSWTEINHFKFENDNLRLIRKEKSKVNREHFDTGE